MFILNHNPLLFISILPLIGIFYIIVFIPATKELQLKTFSLFISSVIFISSLIIWVMFVEDSSHFQFFSTYALMPFFNMFYTMGIDGISLFFLVLSAFLMNICMLISWESPKFFIKEYFLCFLFLEFCLMQVFCVLDIFLFYIFFESVLIPMFLMMVMWGSRERKMSAAFQFFLYTLMGSLFMLTSIIYIYSMKGTTDLLTLWFTDFPVSLQLILWFLFFFGFAVKMPMIPFHIWLPEAHAEAPTSGSVMLAGMLLKLGGYGFLSFSLPLFPYACVYFSPLVFLLSLIAIVYGALTTLRQIYLKKMMAYSSISHMGFVTLGIFSLNPNGIEGSVVLMLSHGLISSAMFFCIGILYDRYATRILKYYSGLVQVMPLFVMFFMFFSFSNISFPGTSSFMGELLILMSMSKLSLSLLIMGLFGMILSASYAIWLLNSMSFGMLSTYYSNKFQDISSSEFFMLSSLTFTVLWLGIYPYCFTNFMTFSILNLYKHLSL